MLVSYFFKDILLFLKSLGLTKLFLDFSPYLYYNIIVDNIYSKERGVPNDRNAN